jgi:hypothetical protein
MADSVLRVARNSNFKTISLIAVNDPRLSWKAKGLHTYLVSRPDGWKFHKFDLEARSSDGRSSLSTAMGELQAAGYLRVEPGRGEGGRLAGWVWTVYEEPFTENTKTV